MWNHRIRNPVPIFSVDDGPNETTLSAFAHGDAHTLAVQEPSDDERQQQLHTELDQAWQHLRAAQDNFWSPDWRRKHKGYGIYPEQHLFNAVWAYTDLRDALDET